MNREKKRRKLKPMISSFFAFYMIRQLDLQCAMCNNTSTYGYFLITKFLNGAEWCIRKCINIERTWTQASARKMLQSTEYYAYTNTYPNTKQRLTSKRSERKYILIEMVNIVSNRILTWWMQCRCDCNLFMKNMAFEISFFSLLIFIFFSRCS